MTISAPPLLLRKFSAFSPLALLVVGGCATFGDTQTVKVPIPVPCLETEPDRPSMPTDSLKPGGTLFDAVVSMQAELEIREGYEKRLATALRACIRPIKN